MKWSIVAILVGLLIYLIVNMCSRPDNSTQVDEVCIVIATNETDGFVICGPDTNQNGILDDSEANKIKPVKFVD